MLFIILYASLHVILFNNLQWAFRQQHFYKRSITSFLPHAVSVVSTVCALCPRPAFSFAHLLFGMKVLRSAKLGLVQPPPPPNLQTTQQPPLLVLFFFQTPNP